MLLPWAGADGSGVGHLLAAVPRFVRRVEILVGAPGAGAPDTGVFEDCVRLRFGRGPS